MTNRVFRMINRFFEGTGDVIGTPSGDARGHLRRPDFMQQDVDRHAPVVTTTAAEPPDLSSAPRAASPQPRTV